jgi:predicted ArsR family transcriptional regulator
MTVQQQIENLMSDYRSRSAAEISKELGLPVSNLSPALGGLVAGGNYFRVKSYKPGKNTRPQYRYKLIA